MLFDRIKQIFSKRIKQISANDQEKISLPNSKQSQSIEIKGNPEIKTLQKEVRGIELQISIASEEKSEIEKLIYSFNLRYSKELGDIVIKILKLKRGLLENEPEKKNEFNAADNDYQRFQEQHEADFRREQINLSQTELKELKQSFRKASKLCHPDTVAPGNKKNAEALFIELKAAYERNDLQKVKEILASLENNKLFNFRSDSTSELEQLLIELEKLKIRLKEIQIELQNLKTSDVYNEIIDIVDWGEYFETKKFMLIEELSKLEASK